MYITSEYLSLMKIKIIKIKGEKIMMSEKTKTVLNYLKEIGDANVTSADIAAALGMEKKSVDGIVTSGLQRKELAQRIPAEIEVTKEDGTIAHQPVKFIKLTDAGKAFDPDAEVAE